MWAPVKHLNWCEWLRMSRPGTEPRQVGHGDEGGGGEGSRVSKYKEERRREKGGFYSSSSS